MSLWFPHTNEFKQSCDTPNINPLVEHFINVVYFGKHVMNLILQDMPAHLDLKATCFQDGVGWFQDGVGWFQDGVGWFQNGVGWFQI